MRASILNAVAIISLLTSAGCHSAEHHFSSLTEEFVYSTLSFSPTGATAAGLHQYKGRHLDEELDDLSPAALDHQRNYYQQLGVRLERDVTLDTLPPEAQADYRIMQDQIALALLDLEETQSYLHNPAMYVELVGNALFTPFVQNYAPKPTRVGHIIARLQRLPLFLDQAQTNLASAPGIWTKVAMQENQGNIALVDEAIRAAVPNEQRADFDRAAQPALDALRRFQNYL